MSWVSKTLERAVVKALNSSAVLSRVNEALFKWVGVDMPVWMKYNVDMYIQHAYERNADVFAVINKIASKAAEVPWVLERKEGGEWVEVEDRHPITDTWGKPNETQGGYEFRAEHISFYLATGNGYIHGLGPKTGEDASKFMKFYIMPANLTKIISGGWREPIKAYEINWDRTTRIEADTVLHQRTPNLDYTNGQSLYGMSPIQPLARTVTSSNSAQDAKVRDFQSGGFKGFISGDGDSSMLESPEQMKDMINRIKQASKTGEIPATPYNFRFNPAGLSVVDMAILDSMKADLKAICNVYGISSILFNDDAASTYNNVIEAKKSMYTDVIMPLLKNFQDELNRWWVSSWGDEYRLRPDYSEVEVLQADKKAQAERLAMSWWIPPNVKLVEQGYDPIEDERFDVPWVPVGLMPLSEEVELQPDEEDLLKRLGLNEYQMNGIKN